eukprot:7563025-Pyramimonas_sp.AAC.1
MVSEQSLRWLAPPPQVAALRWQGMDFCKKCGIEVLTSGILGVVRPSALLSRLAWPSVVSARWE